MKRIITALFFISIAFGQRSAVKVGADVLFESRMEVINGKNIGLVTNHTAVLSNGNHLADALHATKNVSLVALFGPEHGVRGDAPDGRTIRDTVDSLYGKINKPTPEMLNNVDVLIFDIQDVGARFYTFISTMFLCMEAAAENNIPFIVLDRPNPITGNLIGGPMRVDSLKTFVGWVPVPNAHGMTVGELALMANKEGWLKDKMTANLTVVKMENWKRSMWYDETSLRWIKPSPNMATLTTAIVYPGLCLIEGINVSEGRGTEKPFEYIGAPWINGKKLTEKLQRYNLPGVIFESIDFTPKEIANVAANPKYKGITCGGIYVKVSDRTRFNPVKTGIAVVAAIHALYPDTLKFRDRGFDRLAGTPMVREAILNGTSVEAIVSSWSDELKEFSKKRIPSLLYFD